MKFAIYPIWVSNAIHDAFCLFEFNCPLRLEKANISIMITLCRNLLCCAILCQLRIYFGGICSVQFWLCIGVQGILVLVSKISMINIAKLFLFEHSAVLLTCLSNGVWAIFVLVSKIRVWSTMQSWFYFHILKFHKQHFICKIACNIS